MRDDPRTTALSAAAGVVLLGGLFAFTVLVPEIGDEPEHSYETSSEPLDGPMESQSGPIELPDQLDGDLVAVDLGTLPADLAQRFGEVEAVREQEAAVVTGLSDVFQVPAAFRVYAATDGSALAQITVLDRAPGLFAPDALPVDPAAIGLTRAASELVRVGDAVCSVSWAEQVPAGQPIDPAVEPQGVRCQLGVGERTFEITAQGLTVDETVANLDSASA